MPPVTSAMRALVVMSAPPLVETYGAARASRAALHVSGALHREGDAHAAADAERRQALLRVAASHLVQQRDEHATARRTDRMPQRDSAAVDVDLRGVPAHLVVHRARLRRERFVDLH